MYRTVVLILLAANIEAQGIPRLTAKDGAVTFEAVADLDSLSAEEIHERTLNWFGGTFRNAEAVIVSETKSRIVGRYYQGYGELGRGFFHQLTIDIKPGRLRYVVSDMGGGSCGRLESWILRGDGKWKTMYESFRLSVENGLNDTYHSLIDYIKNSDW